MRIAVTGSVATDVLMTFPGRFADQLLPDSLDKVSLSFLVDEMVVHRGGVAANICYGMGLLGLSPVLVAAVGEDFGSGGYRAELERVGVDVSGVATSASRHTARFMCTTDLDQNQIASFYGGAMAEARDIDLAPLVERLGGLDLVVVSPDDPAAMVLHTEQARTAGIPFAADPSQQLARIDPEQIRALVDGATYLFTNEYERELVEAKSGWSAQEVLDRVDTWVTTLGRRGVRIERGGERPIAVSVAPERGRADPTGVGDAFRAGFLSARSWGLDLTLAARVGSQLATYVLETVGTQQYDVETADFLERLGTSYGEETADEVRAHLSSR